MDAFLSSGHIKIVKAISPNQVEIINNTYKPRKETINVYTFSKHQAQIAIINQKIIDELKQNKNIICSITC